MGKAASHIRRKGLKDPVLWAVATDQQGNTYKCNSQETMIPAMAKSNSNWQHSNSISNGTTTRHLWIPNGQWRKGTTSNGRYLCTTRGNRSIGSQTSGDSKKGRLNPLDLTISPEDNQSGWKKQKEWTSSEPMGPRIQPLEDSLPNCWPQWGRHIPQKLPPANGNLSKTLETNHRLPNF